MKQVFNSLGSNYSREFVAESNRLLLSPKSWRYKEPLLDLKEKLEQKYNGRAQLFYKGRDAISFVLRSFGVGKRDEVLTQGLTCWAVEEGIWGAGAKPVFVDVAPRSLNLNVASLTEALRKTKKPKAVLVQHTLGYPADVRSVRRFCDKHKLILVEDLAHSVGARSGGDEVGSLADAVVFSFGKDKIVDAISGGAGVVKNAKNVSWKFQKQIKVPLTQLSKDLLYPRLTYTIRSTYGFGLGKVIHKALRKIGILGTPLESPLKQNTLMSSASAKLTLMSFKNLNKSISHRRNLVGIYHKSLEEWSFNEVNDWGKSSCLRYPVVVNDRNELVRELKAKGVYVGDIWYKKVVDEGRLSGNSKYKNGTCMRAEVVVKKIINLPTHEYVSEKKADMIAKIVRKYV